MTVSEDQVALLAEVLHALKRRGREWQRGGHVGGDNDKSCKREAREILTLLSFGGWRITRD